jgi:hypothetical protein
MPPLGEGLRRIALTAAMVEKIGCKQKNTNKAQLFAS